MATYYRWNKYSKGYVPQFNSKSIPFTDEGAVVKYSLSAPSINSDGTFNISSWSYRDLSSEGKSSTLTDGHKFCLELNSGLARTTQYYDLKGGSVKITNISSFMRSLQVTADAGSPHIYSGTTTLGKGSFIGYVYSLNSSAYPSDGISGDYYYDSRTFVDSPTQPSGLTYPATITTPSVAVSWPASASLVPEYSVNLYEVSYSTNGGTSWTVAGTTSSTSYSFSIPAGATSIMFRVRARDSNNQYGAYTTGTVSQVAQTPTLTVPEMVMQGQSATVSWSEVGVADSYILQRLSSADTDWTQVYAGANTTYTETVGTWTSLQYRVCAVFEETSGGWATSGGIQIVAASALVISGSDGDLGTLTSDVSYSVSSDQTSPVIDVTVAVNGGEYASFQATSGQNYSIGVLDLPTGTGSIVITASTVVSEAPVTVTRTWTYAKAAQSFPNAGSVARLTQEGDTIWPQTLAEAVRTTGGPWGGDLSKALDLLMKAATYDKETGDFSDLWGNDIPTVKIETGSYTGTGTYGASNPNTLTFSFEPQIVFILSVGISSSVDFLCMVNGAYWGTMNSYSTGLTSVTGSYSLIPTFSGTGVEFYSTVSNKVQGNISGLQYYYVAIG